MTRGQFYRYYRPGKPGWSRRWALVVEVAKVAGLTVLLLWMVVEVYLAIWLAAPAGAR